jgi:antitoxin component YwqK of YwqJK toxin-antitoxin module
MSCSPLASINIVDANGVSEIISNDERLKQYEKVDFLVPQPYKKVLRVYKRDAQGNIASCITTYHPNGELKQYLEIINGRAFGEYGIWYENGVRKVQARVIGGPADLYDNVERAWLFDGCCSAYSQEGVLEAEIPYAKGKREGIANYYHKNGAIWKQICLRSDRIEGEYIVYFDNGMLFEQAQFCNGKKEGPAMRFWGSGAKASEECFEDDRLIEGRYYSAHGELISEVIAGSGFKAIFGKECVIEFQEYRAGLQDGKVQLLDKKGNVTRSYGCKEGLKHGEEVEYDPLTRQPKLSINWVYGKIQGLTKSWYANGVQESQREMAANKKMGILTAWYQDGSLMLIENYDQDKLLKGEYYKHGDSVPISSVIAGDGIATLYDANGIFIRKVTYSNGKPEE